MAKDLRWILERERELGLYPPPDDDLPDWLAWCTDPECPNLGPNFFEHVHLTAEKQPAV